MLFLCSCARCVVCCNHHPAAHSSARACEHLTHRQKLASLRAVGSGSTSPRWPPCPCTSGVAGSALAMPGCGSWRPARCSSPEACCSAAAMAAACSGPSSQWAGLWANSSSRPYKDKTWRNHRKRVETSKEIERCEVSGDEMELCLQNHRRRTTLPWCTALPAMTSALFAEALDARSCCSSAVLDAWASVAVS